jgi:hypothetical protein
MGHVSGPLRTCLGPEKYINIFRPYTILSIYAKLENDPNNNCKD